MIPGNRLKISLLKLSSIGYRILAQQSEISYQQALQQAQRVKLTSRIKLSSKKQIRLIEKLFFVSQ